MHNKDSKNSLSFSLCVGASPPFSRSCALLPTRNAHDQIQKIACRKV